MLVLGYVVYTIRPHNLHKSTGHSTVSQHEAWAVGTPEPDHPDAEPTLPPRSCVTSSKLVSTLCLQALTCRMWAIMVGIGWAVQRIK